MLREPASLPVDDFPRGSSVLISGPPLSGKYDLMCQLLVELGERVVVVSTDDPATGVRTDIESLAGDVDDDRLGIVDCVTSRQKHDVTDSETVKYASSAENLTQIGVKFTELAEAFAELDGVVAVGFHSFSPLLMYWDVERVYQFVRVLSGQIRDEGWTFVGVIGSTMHDEQTLHTLYDPFDAVIDTRDGENGREFRRRDSRGTSATEWAAF